MIHTIDKIQGLHYLRQLFKHFNYCDLKLKLNPSANLSSLIWPGGKNLPGRGVVGSPMGAGLAVVKVLPASSPARSPASKCFCW